MNYFIKLFVASLALTAAFISEAQDQAPQGQVLEKIIAKIDNEIVLNSDLEISFLQFQQQNNAFTDVENVKCKVLETLIVNKLLIAKAALDSVEVDDETVQQQLDTRMNMLLQQFGGNEETLIKEYGKTVAQLKNEYREDVKNQLLIQKMQQKISKSATATPKEVEDFFNEIPKDSLPFFPMELEIGQIVKKPIPSDYQESQAKKKIQDLLDRVNNGESFESLAKLYSEGPSGKNGGNLGFAKRGDMVTEYEEAALNLKEGEVSKVIKTQFGFHIVQLIERRGNEYSSRHILIKIHSSSLDQFGAKTFLDSLKNEIEAGNINFSKAAFEHSDDDRTKNSGGLYTDTKGNTKLSAEPDKIDPDLFFLVTPMKAGDISDPIEFDTPDGKMYRIVWLKSKTDPHQANLKDDYQKIKDATIAEKQNSAVLNWFAKTKNEVFIQIDDEYNTCSILED